MKPSNPAERWAIANAEKYPLPDLLEPITDSFGGRVEPDTEGGIVVTIPTPEEDRTSFVCQLAYFSGWIVTNVMFSGHCIRLQDPSRFEELSKDRWRKSTRNERLAPDWDELSELEDYLDDS